MRVAFVWAVVCVYGTCGLGGVQMTKQDKTSSETVVIDSNVCKTCGTKIFYMMTKNKFKCVLCRVTRIEGANKDGLADT